MTLPLVRATLIGGPVATTRPPASRLRRAAIEKGCSSVGGKLGAFYYAFGKSDVVCVSLTYRITRPRPV